jgi:hypothetical protein
MLPSVNSFVGRPQYCAGIIGESDPADGRSGARRTHGANRHRQNAAPLRQICRLREVIGSDEDRASWGRAMAGIRNGLYTVETVMTDGGRGHATGVIVLLDGKIAGGDTHFYYTGTYTAADGKWRGELTTFQHAKPVGVVPLFGGREVTCGFTGTYSSDSAVVSGTALVGKTSVLFETRLKFCEGL